MKCDVDLALWKIEHQSELENNGYTITLNEHPRDVYSLDIDGDKFVGTITLWIGKSCEVQFNEHSSGDVALLVADGIFDNSTLTNIVAPLGILKDK